LPVGHRAQVLEVSGELDVAARLRELGLLEGAQIIVIRQSDPVLVVLQDARIALDHQIATGIAVEPLGA
jgi:Fe2+ transport system protein FeoA